MMEAVILLPFVLGAWLANYAEAHRQARPLVLILLTLVNLLLIAMGFLMAVAGWFMRSEDAVLPPGMPPVNFIAVGLAAVATGLVAFLPMIPFVRRVLAWRMPINPQSIVHTTALVYAVYFLGNSAATLLLIGAVAEDEELAQQVLGGLSPADAWITGFVFALLALAGVGLFVRRNLRQTLDRLGLHGLDRRQWAWAGATLAALLAAEIGISVVWERLDPAGFQRVGGLTDAFISSFLTPWGAVTVGLAAGIGEELLFRGALQPRFGLLSTALLFTIAHVQYTVSPALLAIFVVALGLGILRARVNTTACIAVHATFNFLQVILMTFQAQ
jgi:hypothetical protein